MNTSSKERSDVALIGCGVVALVIAYYLKKQGFEVTVFDKNIDPRSSSYKPGASLGASYSGGNARIFSFNEARHHNFGRHCKDTKLNTQFRRYFFEGGWMGATLNTLTEADQNWISNFEAISELEGETFDRDIISFNQESSPLWEQMKLDIPSVFEEGGLVEGLVRLYQTSENSTKGIQQELSIGSFQAVISQEELADRNPLLTEAIKLGNLALAIDVEGFSVNCQSFCCEMITYLEQEKVIFHWNTEIERITRTTTGDVSGIITHGEHRSYSNYVFSTGWESQGLLKDFNSEGLIAPIYGMWLTLPYDGDTPFQPIKISRHGFASPGAAEGANIIPGKDSKGNPVIFVSSGHGYMGIGNTHPDDFWARELMKASHETAQTFFPCLYKKAILERAITDEPVYCVRPWTPSGLGLFESVDTVAGGRFCIVGGNSTGGFAQSPSIAQAVIAKLENRTHNMHKLYDPIRTKRKACDRIVVGQMAG